ncbi:MAG: bacillithiol biosynthesis cysteine-adding enzyme BshC [Candidatus Binatia bacterium]
MGDLFEAYLAGGARTFFNGHYAEEADRRSAVLRATRPLRPDVAGALAAQNARLGRSDARAAHVAALARGAATVVTGQQMGLFLGPLYTLYKAASAVVAARALAQETGKPVVPVFWLQNEDHDVPEISACGVPGADGRLLNLQLPSPAGERISVAHRALPAEVAACLERLAAEIGHLPCAAPHLERLGRHYRPGATWTDAFAGLLAELFAAEGLVLLDPRDPALARAIQPAHHRALERAEALAGALAERGRALADAGFAATVHVRPGAPLCFFHPDGAAGPRYRLEPAPGGFAEVGGGAVHAREALLSALEAEPLRFSSSALLRPIVQDTVLPTAAYIGGPGEVAYFAQLAPLYAEYDLPMPLLMPRARFRLLEEKTARLLARLGLAAADVGRPEDELLAVAGARGGALLDRGELSQALLAPFESALAALRGRIEASGAGLGNAVEKTRAAVATAVDRLAAKVARAQLHRDAELVRDVRRAKQLLCPNGVPQERVYGISYFAARYGERAFVERVLASIAPFDAAVRDIAWPERGEGHAAAAAGEVGH